MRMLIKIHKSYRTVVALCDKELLGEKFQEKNMQIDLTGNFFKGEQKTEKEILELIDDLAKEDATFSIAGEKAVRCALKAGIINKEGIIRIQGIPIALTLL